MKDGMVQLEIRKSLFLLFLLFLLSLLYLFFFKIFFFVSDQKKKKKKKLENLRDGHVKCLWGRREGGKFLIIFWHDMLYGDTACHDLLSKGQYHNLLYIA